MTSALPVGHFNVTKVGPLVHRRYLTSDMMGFSDNWRFRGFHVPYLSQVIPSTHPFWDRVGSVTHVASLLLVVMPFAPSSEPMFSEAFVLCLRSRSFIALPSRAALHPHPPHRQPTLSRRGPAKAAPKERIKEKLKIPWWLLLQHNYELDVRWPWAKVKTNKIPYCRQCLKSLQVDILPQSTDENM